MRASRTLPLVGLISTLHAQFALAYVNIGTPTVSPSAIHPTERAVLFVTSPISGTTDRISVSIQRLKAAKWVHAGKLVDNASHGDIDADDGVYSGRSKVRPLVEGNITYRLVVTERTLKQKTTSQPFSVSVVAPVIPVTAASSDRMPPVLDQATGLYAVCDEVWVSFAEGTGIDQIMAIVGDVGGSLLGSIPELKSWQVMIPCSGDFNGVNDALAKLRTHSEVRSAEPNYLTGSATSQGPDDPHYVNGDQWGLYKIHAAEAWQLLQQGNTIAVVDSGINYNHQDLGPVLKGRDFIDKDDDPLPDSGDAGGFHGTFVAGIAAAKTNNNTGVAGAAFSAHLIAERVCCMPEGGRSVAPTSYVWQGIVDAVNSGASVINLSLASYAPSPAEADAVSYASDHGVVVVAAAGNDNCDKPEYPASIAGVISVGASDAQDVRSLWAPLPGLCETDTGSNFGPRVDVYAPGTNIWSTSLPYADSYDEGSGTSFAAPFVAGVAALIKRANFALTPAQVRQIIIDSADVGQADPLYPTRNGPIRRLNASGALMAALGKSGTTTSTSSTTVSSSSSTSSSSSSSTQTTTASTATATTTMMSSSTTTTTTTTSTTTTVPVCSPGSTRSCNTGLLGICAAGTQTCNGQGTGYGSCVQNQAAQVEGPPSSPSCSDGADNDCDGATDSADTGCNYYERVANGNFSQTNSGWVTSGSFQYDSRFSSCHSCPGYAYLANADGTSGNSLTGILYQYVGIPASATSARFTFWYYITTQEAGGVANDFLNVSVWDPSGTSHFITQLSNLNASGGYSQLTFDITSLVATYGGGTYRINLLGQTNATLPTTFRVDDVSLQTNY